MTSLGATVRLLHSDLVSWVQVTEAASL